MGPHLVRFTDHAAWRAERRGIGLEDAESIVLEQHERRRSNRAGNAAWRVERGRIVVLYDWPIGDDEATALVRTVWRE
jgi:hypothetical protein